MQANNIFQSAQAQPLRNATAAHPAYTDGQPLVLDFQSAHAALVAGLDTPEAELLRLHLQLAASANPSICWIFDSLRASARGDARTGRTLRSQGEDGLPYWGNMGTSKVFRAALGAIPWVTQAHAAHSVVTQNREDGTSGQAGRTWQGSGFTRTRTQVTIAQQAQPQAQAQPEADADGMDAPDVAPIRIRKGKRNK